MRMAIHISQFITPHPHEFNRSRGGTILTIYIHPVKSNPVSPYQI